MGRRKLPGIQVSVALPRMSEDRWATIQSQAGKAGVTVGRLLLDRLHGEAQEATTALVVKKNGKAHPFAGLMVKRGAR